MRSTNQSLVAEIIFFFFIGKLTTIEVKKVDFHRQQLRKKTASCSFYLLLENEANFFHN